MFKLLFIFCTLAFTLQAQSNDSTSIVLLLNSEYLCPFSKLDKIEQQKTAWEWTVYEDRHRILCMEQFTYLKQHIRSKTKYSNIFDDCLCVQLASVSPKNDALLQTGIEIYEIGFEHEYQCESFMKIVKKYKVTHYDAPDVSLPMKFYTTEKSVFIFLDAEEPHEPTFNRIFTDFCRLLDDTR